MPDNKRVVVVGGGAREHAIIAKLGDSPRVGEIIACPGSDAIGLEPRVRREKIAVNQITGLMTMAHRVQPDLVLVGPELPLTLGLADALGKAGFKVFGPKRDAARFESSKAFAKKKCKRYGIPTGDFVICYSVTDVERTVRSGRFAWPMVFKADGLAQGKGVHIARSRDEFEALRSWIVRILRDHPCIVIEEFLEGKELSAFDLVHGGTATPFGFVRDHKLLNGKMTGGMASFSPVRDVDRKLEARIWREIVVPLVEGMEKDGIAYTGFLYLGLMLTPDGPKVLEINVRLGDPEAEVILARFTGDLYAVIEAAMAGCLDPAQITWDLRAAVCLVLTSAGYPDEPRTGDIITGLEPAWNKFVRVYHAGTKWDADAKCWRTAGGRVVGVTALRPTLEDALWIASEVAERIKFDGKKSLKDLDIT